MSGILLDVEAGGRLHIDEADHAVAVLVLGHGAGGGLDAADLVACATNLPVRGITVVRHEQSWVATGRKVAPRPAVLDEAWGRALRAVAGRYEGLPIVAGGRSAGARVACRGAANPALPQVTGLVCLSFPLHLPGKPEKSRIDELRSAGVDTLVVQGERDPFGTPDELRASVPDGWFSGGRVLVEIPGAGHGLVPPASVLPRAEALARITGAAADFVREYAGSPEALTRHVAPRPDIG